MLDFLGLTDDAAKVFIGLIIMGIALGIPFGAHVGTKNGSKATTAGIVIGTVISVITIFICAWPAFMLFITFQWKWILLPLLAGILVFAIFFSISFLLGSAARIGKYKRNPVIKRAVKYCKENDIVAIQCHGEMIRFYGELKNTEYCSDDKVTRYAATDSQCDEYLDSDFRPDHWRAYDRFPTPGEDILFADMGYPPLEDIDIFAKALASCLGGCAIAKHESYVEFKGYYVNRKTGIGKRAHHFIYTQNDRFVYKKKALAELIKKTGGPKKPAPEKKEEPKPENKWE
ncbi:MAG: hypothetical protein IJD22_04495 [Clostridia bacterium]|nr:hypothetical protein [Clostridia bacterium]